VNPDVTATPAASGASSSTVLERPVLELREVQAGYGSVPVVRSLDLSVERGTVLGLLGPNGAGKSTLMMTLAGLLPRLGGEVLVDGKPIPSGRPALANRSGVVLVADDRALFTSLSVKDNLAIARRKDGPTIDSVYDLFPVLGQRRKQLAGTLSGGEQQMLAVARGLVQKPEVLLIDEMSMGLAPVIVEGLLPVVRRIADETGAVVVLVEQHVKLALEVCDRAVVLVHGEVVLRGEAAALAADPGALEAAYLGHAAATPA
jgi:branched-chain amino acid transport system ATP-binding protein